MLLLEVCLRNGESKLAGPCPDCHWKSMGLSFDRYSMVYPMLEDRKQKSKPGATIDALQAWRDPSLALLEPFITLKIKYCT